MKSNKNNHFKYQSLNELVSSLSEADGELYDKIIRTMEISSAVFENCCSWSKESYTRNCIVQNAKFELILLCWEKGQKTPIHDHGGEECWVKIIEGEFKESIYKENELGELNSVKSTITESGEVTYMSDSMGCHRLENISNSRGMSLHFYAKPIYKCNVFDEDLGIFVRKDLAYNTVFDLKKKINKKLHVKH